MQRDNRKLTHPRDDIRQRENTQTLIDPRQSKLEQEANRIEASITAGLAVPEEPPTAAAMAEAEFKEHAIITQRGEPIGEINPDDIERKAKEQIQIAAAMRAKMKQDLTAKQPNALFPDQEPLVKALMAVYLWYIGKGLDPDAAADMTKAYATMEAALVIRAGLEPRPISRA